MRTRFTELAGCEFPVQLAAMGGGIGSPRLAFAVAAAGALGMIGTDGFGRAELVGALGAGGGGRTPGHPVGAGFLMPSLNRDTVAAVAPLVKVVEFFYGDPDPALVQLGHGGGALVSWQVGSAEEARAAAGAGCDFLIAQGSEAGGHLRGRIGVLMLLDEVLGAVDVPVLAAGGVATARGMAAALAAGADGVRVGTRFLLAEESAAHPHYRSAVIAASAGDTVVTRAFKVSWPDAPHRVLRVSLDAAAARTGEVSGASYPGGRAIPLFASSPPADNTGGDVDALAHYAGESVGAATEVLPAADIVRQIAGGAETLLRDRMRDLGLG
jgi:NAD(P)H-dependent flavin oxidoreductase YrpB (nitropropane dioxygenase family)